MRHNLILLFLLCRLAYGGISGEESSPLSLAYGGLNTALPLGAVSLYSNPSWLAGSTGPHFSASVMNYYNISGLNQGQVSGACSFKKLGLGAGVSYLSVDSIYREGVLVSGAAYGIKRISAGAVFKLRYRSFSQEEQFYSYTMSAGANARLFRGLVVSFATNPTIPITFGFCYLWPEGTKTALEAECVPGFPVVVRFAQELCFFRILAVRAGIRSEPLTLSFGIGVKWHGMNADVAAGNHPDLGVSKSAGVAYFASGQ